MLKDSHTGSSYVQQLLFNLAAIVVVVAGLRASIDILIPFLLAIFISVIANPIVKKLNSRGIPVSGSIILVIIGIITLGIGITSLLGTSLNDFSENLPQYKILINKSANNFFTFLNGFGFLRPSSSRGSTAWHADGRGRLSPPGLLDVGLPRGCASS